MITVVNGFICQSSCDEAVARKGRDPRNPKDDPAKAEALAIRDGEIEGVSSARDARIVSFDKDALTVAATGGIDRNRRKAASSTLVFDSLA